MGRELQKKKRRSGRQPVRTNNRRKRPLNPLGNSIIAENWDKKQTLAQNYRRLGLTARLKAPTGGTEKPLGAAAVATLPRGRSSGSKDPLAIANIESAPLGEAKVERDASGKIIRVISRTLSNPLNDPLNDLDSDSGAEDDGEEWGGIEDDGEGHTEVVRSLIAESRNEAPKKPRHQSEREREWLERLVARHGDDTAAMARDRKLNPMQQTAADLARRIKKLKT